jgi:hypothetical protein
VNVREVLGAIREVPGAIRDPRIPGGVVNRKLFFQNQSEKKNHLIEALLDLT